MKICKSCGEKLSDHARFCPQCGAPVPSEESENSDTRAGSSQDKTQNNPNPVKKKKIELATISLILGIVGFATGFIFVGMILDAIAIIIGIKAIKENCGANKQAYFGIGTGACGLALMIIIIALSAGVSKEARAVNKQISDIGEVSIDSGEKISEARQAYEQLDDKDQKDVSDYKKLVKDEETYNQIAASKAVAAIGEIGAVGTNSQKVIEAARTAYESLTPEQQKYVSNYSVLTEDEAAFDTTKAGEVETKYKGIIDRIGEKSAVYSELTSDISSADAAYQDLTESQKPLVKNHDEFETTIEKAKTDEEQQNTEKVKKAEELNNAIVKAVNSSEKPYSDSVVKAIKAARTAYDALSDAQKEMVENYDLLTTTEEGYSEYQIALVQAAINNAVNKNSGYDKAQSKYEKLNSSQQSKIQGYSQFVSARKIYNDKKERQEYIDQCAGVSYDKLRHYPDTYQGKKIKLNLTVTEAQPDGLIFPGDIIAVISGTGKEVAVYDSRAVKEPRFVEGDSITVYGTADDLVKMTTYVKGSGLLGPICLQRRLMKQRSQVFMWFIQAETMWRN